MDRESAIDALVNHHSSQPYHPEHHYQNVVDANGEYLWPYVPYIGKHYSKALLIEKGESIELSILTGTILGE